MADRRRRENMYTVHRVDREALILAAIAGYADPSTIRIARELKLHPNTIRRWFRRHPNDDGYDRLMEFLEAKVAEIEGRGDG